MLLDHLPLPPPSERRLLSATDAPPVSPADEALRLLSDHAALLHALSRRSKADFRPLPVLLKDRLERLREAFRSDDPLPPSLLDELAPLLRPRLVRLGERLRRRLGRTRCELPLTRLREMDPASLRRNLRRPGRDLVEKAGPQQRLWGVRRVEKYDTQENRVLVAACERIGRAATELLRRLPKEQRKAHPRGGRLLKVLRAAAALRRREELLAVGLPRPGDRPSFALLKDPDYRAVYRGLQLLRGEDERFCAEWAAHAQVRDELLLLATWTWLDTRSGAEAAPNWVRVHGERADRPGYTRVESLHDGRWLRFTDEAVEEWVLSRQNDELWLRHRLFLDGESVESAPLSLTRRLREAPPDRRVFAALDGVLAPLLADPTQPQTAAGDAAPSGLVALSALGPRLLLLDDQGARCVDSSAAARLTTDQDAAQPGTELPVFGRAAALLPEGTHGPLSLHREHIDLGGRLLAAHRPSAASGLAVVVPDRLDELALARLREGLGPCWAVWHSVAVALCWAEGCPEDAAEVLEERRVLVVALSAAANDVAVLRLRQEDGHRVLLRLAPPPHPVPADEELLLAGAGDQAGPLRAAWLRAPDARAPWLDAGAAGFARAALPDLHDQRLAALRLTLRAYAAAPPELVLLSGGDERLRAALAELLPGTTIHALAEDAALRGARCFLQRHGRDLPTWKEELPPLSAEVRTPQGRRERIPIIPPGQWVAPGQRVAFTAQTDLILDPGRREIDLPLYRGDAAAPTPFCLHIAGRHLPLSRAARVRITLRFRYGQDSLTGELRAQGEAPFYQLPFLLSAATVEEEPEHATPPEYHPPTAPTAAQMKKLRECLDGLRRAWRAIPEKERRARKGEEAFWIAPLKDPLKALVAAAAAVQGSGPRSLEAADRDFLERQAAPVLDWLLGAGKSPERDGDAPMLHRDLRDIALRARSRCAVRGAEALCVRLQKVLKDPSAKGKDREEAWKALGGIIDGRADAAWDALVGAPTPTDADLRWQGWAMSRALYAHPALARALSAAQAEGALSVVCDALRRLPPDERHRDHFAMLFQVIPHLCRARESGHLGPRTAIVLQARETLAALRQTLPVAILGYAPGQREQDEPLALAQDALHGRMITLPRVETLP